MPYIYGQPGDYKNPAQFKWAAGDYPTLELPVAIFTNPEHATHYQGSSALANFALRCAIDHYSGGPPSIVDRLTASDLSLKVWFVNGKGGFITHTDLDVNKTSLWLKITPEFGAFAVRWTKENGAYMPDMVQQEDSELPGLQEPLPVRPRTYEHLPTHNEFQTDPALRFDVVFRNGEIKLNSLVPAASVHHISVRSSHKT